MVAFGKRGEGIPAASPFEKMSGYELLVRFYMRGLQSHFLRAQQIADFRTDAVKYDSGAMDDIVKGIQIEINGVSNSNVGSKVTRDDVEKYLREKILKHE